MLKPGNTHRTATGRVLSVFLAALVLTACGPSAPPQTKSAAAPTTAPAAPAKPAAASSAASPGSSPVAAPAGSQSAAAKTGDLATVNIALTPTLAYEAVYVGIEKGIFVKQGVDVKAKFLASGPETTKALQAGEAEIAGANVATLISARAGGGNLKAFWFFTNDASVLNNDDALVIIVPPNSPIQKVADLAGKKVGLTVGGAVDPFIRLQLQDAGVNPSNVELINGTFANMPSILKSGNVDAALFQEPYGELYLNDVPNGRVLVRGGGKVAFRIQSVAREDWLAQNQPLAEKYAVGMAEASQYVRQNQEESAEIATHWVTGLPGVVAARANRHIAFDPRVSPLVAAAWEQDSNTLLEQKRITQGVPFREGFDATLIEQVAQKYPQFYSDLKPLPR